MKEAIWVLHGVIHFIGFNKCSIENNGYNITTSNKNFPGKHYGLIKYQCDDVNGYLISQMSCEKCWIYCPENDLIEGCEQILLPIVIGVICASILTILTFILCTRMIFPTFSKTYHSLKSKNLKNKIRKQDKKLETIRIEIELHEQNRIRESRLQSEGNIRYPSLSLMTILFLIFCGQGLACDNTIFLTSTGMICDSNRCVNSEMYDLSLETGSIICFRDTESNLMTIKMKSAYILHKSSLVYYTSNFQTSTKVFWACKGKDSCWNGMCHDGFQHPSLKNISTKKLETIKFGCDSDTLGCDTACFYQTSCTYYRLSINPEGQYYPIYKIVSSMWAVELEINYKNVTKISKLNVNNPKINLDSLDNNNIPILISSLSYQFDHIEKYYISINNNYYNIDAANINMPERDKLGDIQISTDKSSVTYNIDDVKCRAISCKVRCSSQEPRVLRVINNLSRYTEHSGYHIDNLNTLVTKQAVNGIAKVMIGNVNLNSLRITLAKCHLDIIGTFSCSACAIKPYAIIQSSNIVEQGLLPFESNCSFSENYLSCNEEPYILEVLSQSKYCKLFVPSINVTLNIVFDYNFLGKLDPSKQMYSTNDNYENYSDFFKNKTIWETLGYSWLGLSVLSLIVSTIMRNFSCIANFLTGVIVTKKAEESVESGNM